MVRRLPRRLVAVVSLVIAGCALAGVLWWARTGDGADSPAAAALFSVDFDDADGKPQALEQWKGKLLVVNFWATWCVPCVEEMPLLQQVQDDFADRNVIVVGVGIDDADKIRQFRREHSLKFPLLAAGFDGLTLVRSLGDDQGVLPYTVVISAEGRVLERHVGRVEPERLRSLLNAHI